MPPSDEHDWIFDFVMQFLESDKFDSSVMDFVDENCKIFDSEEENKFEYTDIHKEFSEHIEVLISSNLGELGISSETFFESCEKGRDSRDINKQVFERMIAMEDFETFKKLMTKRNMELELETIQSYNAPFSAIKSPGKRISGYAASEEDREIEEAVKASLLSSQTDREDSSSDNSHKQGPMDETEVGNRLYR